MKVDHPRRDRGKPVQVPGRTTKKDKDAEAGIVPQELKQGGPKGSGGTRQNQPVWLFTIPADSGGSHAREQKSRITETS